MLASKLPLANLPLKPMKIQFKQQHKSIADITTVELPDFAVLIGRNGAGKTQILEALKEGRAMIPDTGVGDIELRNLSSFLPPNTNRADRNTNQFALNVADAYLLSQSGKPAPNETAAGIFNGAISDIEQNSGAEEQEDFVNRLKSEIMGTADFAAFGAENQNSEYAKAIYRQVLAPLNQGRSGRSSNQSRNSLNGNSAALLSTAMKLADKFPHELTRTDIMRASLCEGDMLSNSISEAFATYKIDQSTWAYTRFDNETERVNRVELMNEYQTENPPPWESLRRILSEMRDAAGDDGLFNFDFSDPSGDGLSVTNLERYSFTAVMTNRTTGDQYGLDSLSSGEKILMALCLVSFNQHLGRRRPKLLLLDEIDTVLHPSMVTAMVALLKDRFVSQGTKVLMTSHSPVTVAALDESEIFRVARTDRRVKVSQITKSEAIIELSEGLATVDVGLRIAASKGAKVTILTEGHNAKHLKKWVQLNFPTDVHVFEGLAEHRSKEQLLFYGRLLGRMNTNTHFVIVWDCDAEKEANTLRGELPDAANVKAYAFKKRLDNTIANSGIENIYDEEILEPYSNTVMNHEGALVARSFQNNRKTEFANQVLQHGTAEYFTHCQDLHDIISGILGSTLATTLPECEEESVGLTNGKKPELPTNAPFMGEVTAV